MFMIQPMLCIEMQYLTSIQPYCYEIVTQQTCVDVYFIVPTMLVTFSIENAKAAVIQIMSL